MGTRWGGWEGDMRGLGGRGKWGNRGRETCPWEPDCRIGFIQLRFLHKLKIEPLYFMRLRMCVCESVYLYACMPLYVFLRDSDCLCYVNILWMRLHVYVCVYVCDCLRTPWERPWEDNGAGDAWEFGLMCRWWVAATDSHRQPSSSPYNARIWTHLAPLFSWKTIVRLLMGTQAYHLYCISSALASDSVKAC